jgi:hypothetical protein
MNFSDISMNNENNQSSSSLKLESLEKKFNFVMKQYEEAFNNYVSYLEYLASLKPNIKNNIQNNDGNTSILDNSSQIIDSRNFIVLKGVTFFGESGLNDTTSKTVEECQALCENDINCSGATFNSDNESCLLRKGKGGIESGEENDNAIIDILNYYMNILKKYNEKLLEINDEMKKEIENSKSESISVNNEYEGKSRDLLNIYNKLLEDKENIDLGMKDIVTLEEQNKEASLMVVSNSYSYSFFFFIMLISFVLIIVFVSGVGNSNMVGGGKKDLINDTFFDFILLILFLGLAFYFKNLAGFVIWALFVIVYVHRKFQLKK